MSQSTIGDSHDPQTSDATENEEDDWKRLDDRQVPDDTFLAHAPRSDPDLDHTTDLEYPRDHCQNCGAHLSRDFRRVYGDDDGVAWKCVHCPDRNKHGLDETRAGTDKEASKR